MLKSYSELRNFDVTPYCKFRDRNEPKSAYLPWAVCVDLLHRNGAEKVYWTPCVNEKGSSLFMSEQSFTNRKGGVNRAFEVRIKIVVDDEEFTANYPVISGISAVNEDTINQSVIYRAQVRCFVKAIAIRFGLGFSLWLDDEVEQEKEEDLSKHNIFSIKERVQQEYTRLLKKRMSVSDIAKALDMTKDEVTNVFTFFDQIDRFERKLSAL